MTTRRDTKMTPRDYAATSQNPELWLELHDELFRIRGAKGEWGVDKLTHYPTLASISGYREAFDAWGWLNESLTDLIGRTRELDAAVETTFGPGESIQDRLLNTAEKLGGEDGADARTARRWSDAGLPALTTQLMDISFLSGDTDAHLIDIRVGEDWSVAVEWLARSRAAKPGAFIELILINEQTYENSLKQRVNVEWTESALEGWSRFEKRLHYSPTKYAVQLQLIFSSLAPPKFTLHPLVADGYRSVFSVHRQSVSIALEAIPGGENGEG